MASRAVTPVKPGRQTDAEWRAGLRRSLRRIAQMTGAGLLLGAAVFLALALASYTQTDPSGSTAADPGEVANWMGAMGAWAADKVLLIFGLPGVLLLPLLYVSARKLWRDVENGDAPETTAWWMPTALLLIAMTLIATVLSLAFEDQGGTLPAQAGGLSGLLGAGAIQAVAARFGADAEGWVILGLALTSLAVGVGLLTRIFAIDWRVLMSLPEFLGGGSLSGLMRRLPLPGRASVPALAFAGDDGDEDDVIAPRPRRMGKGEAAAEPTPQPPRRPPEISDPSAPPKRAAAGKTAQTDMFAPFNLPSLDLLAEPPVDKGPKLDKLALERNARLLENVLDDFNVKGEITAVRTGPVVTMYELEPAPGIKASRVVGLAEDIARNMSAISARVSPIPGRTVMGIELPNQDRQVVMLKELAACADFADAKGNLPIILGKDIAGEPIIADLAAMPHLLVAGTTGSGKSVGLNVILLSLLYRFTPTELRLILIDPKVLELKTYDDIPHLLSPVVTEPAKSVRALKWAVEEMERRYRMMSAISSRNITSFNEKVSAAIAKGKPLGRRVQTGFDPETGEQLFEEEQLDYQPLPQIVLIVDELADLMVTIGKEIEVLIQRLSQKSRAAGIHLIMATQRPSVDVITGVIKANLPTRISFKVTSRIDSRTILGEQGAEQLLGKGDMLYKPNTGAMVRVHGPFVSDEEVEAVADHWRAQGSPTYIDAVTEEPEDGGGFGFDDEFTASDNPEERKYRQACQIVFENQKASGSWLQRQMGVGYNTAAKWIERMEEDGFVGPANHVGRREIYRDKDGNPL
ncbi:S-DNA-T family DNA segregation ATPase FtsK/SpoIIIE [Erythromicrobium ramosum]|uniref:DNA translocase FtsK n=1 Tax=Erythrobacter ramosus TaxID=35811 RepID=A0A6I4UFF8_9SPHN|nr:DNA translocase FtsK 4TM domain-containing protein [Erythrobacter ramosus]MBB3774479.1 S-DNA-T family DNA segregation ATPase FtsK/SpoIIIE [Erythrobacter ramosus]MXP37871.1 DNA translocase FtsK [Erythrobacter ramosus]